MEELYYACMPGAKQFLKGAQITGGKAERKWILGKNFGADISAVSQTDSRTMPISPPHSKQIFHNEIEKEKI